MSLAIAIMAAGKGTRLKSKRPKVLHEVGGKPLLLHVIDAARQIVPPEDIFVIVGYEADQVKQAVSATGVRFVEQKEQLGTGHAIQQTRTAVEPYANLLVLSGDVPLIRPETIAAIRDFHLREAATMTILTAQPKDLTGYGRVVRKSPGVKEVKAIVEAKALTPEASLAREINSGIYAFRSQPLFAHISELQTENAHKELYLTDMAAILGDAGEPVLALEASDADEVLGANTITEMMEIDRKLRHKTARAWMEAGVTIFLPETSIIDADVRIGQDTVIEPFVQLLGSTSLGSGCRIRSYSVLENATVGNDVLVRQGCVVTESSLDDGALLGPYAHVRPGSEIGAGAHVGNFVETKKARLGNGSKANHLAYLGDTEIGSGVNIGAGTITCNYDGVAKQKTIIGDGAFIGSNSTLVAPLSIGTGAYIAAGSSITADVPPEALGLGRARQVTKEGWARERRSRRRVE